MQWLFWKYVDLYRRELFMIPKEKKHYVLLKAVFPLYRIAFAPPYWVSVHTQDSCGGAIPVTGVKVHLTDHNSGASHIGYEFLPYLVSYM